VRIGYGGADETTLDEHDEIEYMFKGSGLVKMAAFAYF
jgi:hypothetical protein